MSDGESRFGLRRGGDDDVAAMTCDETMESVAVPGHFHSCVGRHDGGDHYCAECDRWWWVRA